jgi:hypothetical protein
VEGFVTGAEPKGTVQLLVYFLRRLIEYLGRKQKALKLLLNPVV